jgi:hypothetical protein
VTTFGRALANALRLRTLGWTLMNLEFERRVGSVIELAGLRRGKPVSFGRTELPASEARSALRELGYTRNFHSRVKGMWHAHGRDRLPRDPRVFARRFASWAPQACQADYGREFRHRRLAWKYQASYCWGADGAVHWAATLASITRSRPNLEELAKAARAAGFNGAFWNVRRQGVLWVFLHSAPASGDVMAQARDLGERGRVLERELGAL